MPFGSEESFGTAFIREDAEYGVSDSTVKVPSVNRKSDFANPFCS
jgi:hypothetical protein